MLQGSWLWLVLLPLEGKTGEASAMWSLSPYAALGLGWGGGSVSLTPTPLCPGCSTHSTQPGLSLLQMPSQKALGVEADPGLSEHCVPSSV